MRFKQQFAYAICILTFLAAFVKVKAEDWPHWRGPLREGITSETSGYANGAWPLRTPEWKLQLGTTGESCPIVAQGKLYTMGYANDEDHVYCIDVSSGKIAWTQSYPSKARGRYATGDQELYAEGPLSSPEYDATTGLLYTLSIDGDLNCWDTRNQGKRIWGFNLYDRFGMTQRPVTGGEVRDYGYTTSPFVYGSWLILEVGSSQGDIMAFDKKTGGSPVGTPIWKSKMIDFAGHTGGLIPINIDGIPCISVLSLRNYMVVRLDSGHEGATMADFPYAAAYAGNVVTPSIWKDYVTLSTAHCPSDSVIKVTSNGAAKVGEMPHTDEGIPVFSGGLLYKASGWLECWRLIPQPMKMLWRGDMFGTSGYVILTGDDKLIVSGNNKVELVNLQGKTLSTVQDIPTGWIMPILAEGRLFFKTDKGELRCYELTKG
jgi:outer membrane protein assembly factor BamB